MLIRSPSPGLPAVRAIVWVLALLNMFAVMMALSLSGSRDLVTCTWLSFVFLIPVSFLYTVGTRVGLATFSMLVALATCVLLAAPTSGHWRSLAALIAIAVYLASDARRFMYFGALRNRVLLLHKQAQRATEIAQFSSIVQVDRHELAKALRYLSRGSVIGWLLAISATVALWGTDGASFKASVTIGIVVLALGRFSAKYFRPNPAIQEARDRVTYKLGRQILEAKGELPVQFCLYLRPFDITCGQLDRNPDSMIALPRYHTHRIIDLEVLLGDVTWPLGIPLLALGRPGEAFGAGRLASTETGWQEDLALLMASAKFLFVIPSNHQGTLWELEHLFEHEMGERCLFVMPWAIEGSYGATEWEATRAACREIGLQLPDYDPRGVLLRRDHTGDWIQRPGLKRLARNRNRLELVVLDLLNDSPLARRPQTQGAATRYVGQVPFLL